MTSYFKSNIVVLFSSICLLSSCADDAKDNTTSTDSASATSSSPNTSTSVAQGEPHPFAGKLDMLVAERAAFTDLPNGTKLVFTHNFGDDERVHLKGWVLIGSNFPGTTMTITNGAPSNESFDASTYFSNVVLMPNAFNKIKSELTADNNLKFVLFLPRKVDNYFIAYDIYTSVTSALNNQGLAPTAEANPSPPKTY